MFNIIQHFSESFVKSLNEILSRNLSEEKDLGAIVTEITSKLMEVGLEYLSENLQSLNKELIDSPERKETLDKLTILQIYGNLSWTYPNIYIVGDPILLGVNLTKKRRSLVSLTRQLIP